LLAVALVVIFWKRSDAGLQKISYCCGSDWSDRDVTIFLYLTTNSSTLNRAKSVSIFAKQTTLLNIVMENSLLIAMIITYWDSSFTIVDWCMLKKILGGYLSHFDVNWLFLRGDMPRHHAPGMGLLYVWELPFLLMGIYSLLFFAYPKKLNSFFLPGSSCPSSGSDYSDVPHAVRTLTFCQHFRSLLQLGLFRCIYCLKKNYESRITNYGIRLFVLCYTLFAIFNVVYYLNQYFVQQNYFVSQQWQYGYKEAVAAVESRKGNYKKVVVSNEMPLDHHISFSYITPNIHHNPISSRIRFLTMNSVQSTG